MMRVFNFTSARTLRDLAAYLQQSNAERSASPAYAALKRQPVVQPILMAFETMQKTMERERLEHTQALASLRGELEASQQTEPQTDLMEQCNAHQDQANEMRETLGRMSDVLESELRSNMQLLNHEANNLSEAADQLNQSSEGVNDEASGATAKAQTAMQSTETVVKATTALRISIDTIVQECRRMADRTNQAVAATKNSRNVIASLEDATAQIGDVVDEINAIASQTNLLALNATIEAARAGEAGKGFAVVASEVKGLSRQTATLTERITEQIERMGREVESAVEAMQNVGDEVSSIDEGAALINQSIDTQSEAVSDIASSVDNAQGAVTQMVESLNEVESKSMDAIGLAAYVQSISDGLSATTNDTRERLVKLLRSVFPEADRRVYPRYRVDSKIRIDLGGGETVEAVCQDISRGGAKLRLADAQACSALAVGADLTLQLEGQQFAMQSTVLAIQDSAIRVEFDEVSKQRESFQKYLLQLIDEQLDETATAEPQSGDLESASEANAA